MNKNYRSIWNDALGAWVAVSEIETAKGKPTGSCRSSDAEKAGSSRAGAKWIWRTIPLMLAVLFGLSGQAYATTTAAVCEIANTGNNSTNTASRLSNLRCGNESQVGLQSTAFGSSAQATGAQAVALGADTRALGASSVAVGGDDLTSVSQASKEMYQRLTGESLVRSTRDYSSTDANATTSYPKTLAKEGGVAVGVSATAMELATAFGARASAFGASSLALGVGSAADKENAVAIGAGSNTTGDAAAPRSVEINGVTFNFTGGSNLRAGDQVSFGTAGFERQLRNVAPGVVSETSTDGINGSQLYAVADKLTQVDRNVSTLQGEKVHFYSVSTAGVTDPQNKGNYNNDGATAAKAIAAGVDAQATAEDAIAVGTGARATTATGTIAVGKGAAATGTAGVAVGATSSAVGGSTVAVGNNSNTHRDNGVAVGNKASARGEGGISIGTNAGNNEATVTAAVGNNTVFIGTGAGRNAVGNESHVAVGWDSGQGASGAHNVAMGFQAGQYANGEGNVAIGKQAGKREAGAARAQHTITIGTASQAVSDATVAIGNLSKSEGGSSIALGDRAEALDSQAIAIGQEAKATSDWDISIGRRAGKSVINPANNGRNIAIGDGALEAADNPENNTAIGTSASAKAIGKYNVTIGTYANSESAFTGLQLTKENFAVPDTAKVTANEVVAIGNRAIAYKNNAVSVGSRAKAFTGGALAVGAGSEATGNYSIATGYYSAATGNSSIAIGSAGNNVGLKTHAKGDFAIAIGSGETKAEGASAIAVGQKARAEAANAVVIGKNAAVAAAGSGSVAVGASSTANGVNATAIGQASEASGQNAFAGGQDSHATGKSTVAIGDGAKATVDSAVATGAYSHATEGGAAAFGYDAKASTYRSIAVGAASRASGGNSALAVGNSANASAGDAIAIGTSSSASAAQAVALGRQANADIAGGAAIGYLSKTETAAGVAGTDVLGTVADKANATWTASRAAVSVGNVGHLENDSASPITRQITGLAAGTADTDAVNVAQLKAAGIQVATSASAGEAAQADAAKLKNGETLTLDAGKNIKLVQTGGTVSIATKDDVVFNSVNAGGNVLDGTEINVGGQAYTNVAEAINALASGGTTAKTPYYSVNSTDTEAGSNFDNGGATGSDALAAGVRSAASGIDSVAVGSHATASGQQSLAVGNKVRATALGATAIGNNAEATAEGAQAFGQSSAASGMNSAAVGRYARASGARASAFGVGNIASGASSFSGGDQAKAEGERAVAVGAESHVTAVGGSGVALGNNAVVDSTKGIAIGDGAQAVGQHSANIAIGESAVTNSSGAIVIGTRAKTKDSVDSSSSIAIGVGALAEQKDVTAIGYQTSAVGASSVALGAKAKTKKAQAVAAGYATDAGGYQSVALGASAFTHENAGSSVAVGREARAEIANGVALGSGSVANVHHGAVGADPLAAVADKDNSAWKATYAAVSVGKGTEITRQITSVAAGTEDTDAVNVAQLKAAGIQVATSASEGEATPASEKLQNGQTLTLDAGKNIKLAQTGGKITVATKDDVAFDSVTAGDAVFNSDGLTIAGGPSVTKAGIDAAGKQIGKVAAGQADDDAVNVSQLKDSDNIAKGNMAALGGAYDAATDTYTAPSYTLKAADGTAKPTVNTVQGALSSLNEEIEKPITFAADKGADSERRLGSTVSIKAGNFAGAASADNLVTENDGNGTITVKLADNPVFKGKVSAQGLDAGGQRITGVAQGEQGNDAVNVEQLQQALKDLTVENLSLVSADSPFSYVNAEGEQLIRKVDDKGKAHFVKASDGTTPYEGNDIVVSALNAVDPQTSVPTRVTNVAKGVKDTDAVNTSQLKDVWTALGGSINEQGEAVKPVYEITRADGSPVGTANTVSEALGHLNTALKDPITVSGNTNNGSSTIVQGGSDQKLGSKLAIEGGLVDGTSSAANVRTVVTDGKVEIQLADAPVFAGKVSAKGLDAGNEKITGVAAGTDAADAVNKAQLDAQGAGTANLVGGNTVYNPENGTFANNDIGGTGKNTIHEAIEAVRTTAGAGWNLTAEGENGINVAAGDTVDLASNDKNIVIAKAADSDKVVFDLADDITVNSVKAGDTILASDGLNNGGHTITNVGAGKNLTDAVNVSQLTPLATALGVAFDPATGTVGAPVFTVPRADGSTYPAVNTVQGALDHIGTEIRKPVSFAGNTGLTERKLGETLTLKGSLADNAQASDQNIRTKAENGTMTIELAESPKFGNLTVNDGGKITGLEGGAVAEGSKEAVNGGQLHAQGKGVEAIIGGGTVYNPDTGSYANNNIGGTGESNINDAIAAVKGKADAGWNLTAQGQNSSNVAAGDTVDLANNDKNIVISKVADSDKVVFDLADALTVGSVTAGDTVINNAGVKVGENTALTSDGLSINNPANGKTVSLGSSGLNNGGNVITGVANGLVAEGSQEAVTGDQLFAVDKKVGENTAALEKGLDFAGNSGNFNRRLGERTTVKGGLDNAAAASDTNIRTVADSTGNIQILLADAPVFKGKLTAHGLDAGGQKITNVEDGENEGDAVNVSQLQRALDNQTITHQSLVQANSPFSYVNSKGEVLARQVDSQGKESFIKVADGSEYTEKDITISALNPLDPQTAVPTVVGNIADGKKNNDAVNVGQLKNTVKALGGGAQVNDDGSIKAPVYTITRNDGGHATASDVGEALGLLNTEILKPLTFAGDNQDVKVARTLDTELKVVGGASGNLTDNNIGVTGSTDDNSLTVKLAEKINLGENGSVTAGQTVLDNNGVAVGSNVALTSDGLKAGSVNITGAGIDAGGQKITNVKAGEDATDAVNKAQLDAVKAASSNKVAAGGNLTVKEETNDDGSTTYTLATADDVNFNSVTSGKGDNQVVLDGKGVSVGGDTYLSAQGINANGKKVVNVGKGKIAADSTDAVNGSQLYRTAASVAGLLGGDARVADDGGISMTNIGGTGADNINDAIKAVNHAVTVSKVAVVQGDNIVVDKSANPDGSTTYTVATAKDLKADSISLGGNTTVNAEGISVANGPSLTANGLNAAGTKLTNVADGEISATSKDAVNGSQLYQAYQVLGGNNTSINMKDAPAATDTEGNTTPAGTVTTVVTNPDGTKTTTVETNQQVAVSTDKGGNQYTLTTYNVEGQNTYVTNDVIQAVGKMNEQGIKFFHTNDGEVKAVAQGSNNEDSSASGAYATAIGYQSSAGGSGAVAMGNTYKTASKTEGAQLKEVKAADGSVSYEQRTIASGERAIAMGTGSQALAENTIAIGTGNVVSGKNSGAIGDPTVVTGSSSYSVGNNNTVSADNAYALGSNIKATLGNSVYLGDHASATAVHTTASGGHYTYAGANDANVAGVNDVVGVVSVGTEGQTRQIQNVAAGVVSPTSTDAINGSQLYHTNQAINQVGNQVVNVGNYLNQRIDDVETKSNAGTAAAMAVAGLPQAYLPGKSMMAVSGGTYRGESGYAVGFSSISDNGNWIIKGTATGNSRGHYGATAGVGYQW